MASISVGLRGLGKRFGGVVAVDDLTVDIPAGKLVALLGPSGCGKTTTLRLIAGLTEPSEGDILFDGTSVLPVPTERRNIGIVFQRYVLFPHLTVFDNVAFGLRMRRVPKGEIGRRVREVLALVRLDGLERRRPAELSGGQMQRVALARAIVTNPGVMLLDEPLANLDAKLRLELRELIRSLQRRLAMTTIFVTHDQAEAAALADRVAVMFDGRLHQYAEPRELFEHLTSTRVAEFLGAANLFTGVVRDAEPGRCVVETALGPCAVAPAGEVRAGERVTLTIRPEQVDIGSCDPRTPARPNV